MTADILQVRRDGDFSYPIIFRKDFSDLSAQLKRLGLTKRKFCIVTDSTVAPLYLNTVKRNWRGAHFLLLPMYFRQGRRIRPWNRYSESIST